MLETVGGHGRDELETGADGALGVVLLGNRDPPNRHDGITDELLHDTAVAGDYRPGDVEVAREDLANLFCVSLLRKGRETDEVAEQYRDMTELGSGSRGRRHGLRGSDS